MEELKKLEEIYSPDRRSTYYILVNSKTGNERKYSFADLYREVKSIVLSEAVPDDVKSQFNVARNLALYSWFCYAFHQVSDLKAFSTLEMALRIRLGKPKTKNGLQRLVREAIELGWIKDGDFSYIGEQLRDPKSTSYVEILPTAISHLRNLVAHGSTILDRDSVINLRICADFINKLFESSQK